MPFQLNLNQTLNQNDLARLKQEARASGSSSAELNFDGRCYKVYFIADGSPLGSIKVDRQYRFCQDLFRCWISLGDFFCRSFQSRSLIGGFHTRAARLEQALNRINQNGTDKDVKVSQKFKSRHEAIKNTIYTLKMKNPDRVSDLEAIKNQLLEQLIKQQTAEQEYAQMMSIPAPTELPDDLKEIKLLNPDGSTSQLSFHDYQCLREKVIEAITIQYTNTQNNEFEKHLNKLWRAWDEASLMISDADNKMFEHKVREIIRELASSSSATLSGSFKYSTHPFMAVCDQGWQMKILVKIYTSEFVGRSGDVMQNQTPVPSQKIANPKANPTAKAAAIAARAQAAQSANTPVRPIDFNDKEKIYDDNGCSEFVGNFYQAYQEQQQTKLKKHGGNPQPIRVEGVRRKRLTQENIDELTLLSQLPEAVRMFTINARKQWSSGKHLDRQTMYNLYLNSLQEIEHAQTRLNLSAINSLFAEVESIPEYLKEVCSSLNLPMQSFGDYKTHRKNMLTATYNRAKRNQQCWTNIYARAQHLLEQSTGDDCYPTPYDFNAFLTELNRILVQLSAVQTDDITVDMPLHQDPFARYSQNIPVMTALMHAMYQHEVAQHPNCWLKYNAQTAAADEPSRPRPQAVPEVHFA